MFNPLILLAIVSFVSSHDVIVGTNTEGRKIYDENRHASPTIWRQTENVTITTTDAEVISRIVIKDRRPDKDGDVKIVDGGVGQKNVTLELKSPTVLRGYDFQIEVYSITEDKFKSGDKDVPNLDQTRVQRTPEEERNKPSSPSVVANDEKQDSASKNNPISTDTKVNQNTGDDTNEQKQNGGPVPFVGNRPQTYNVPATEPVRHAREALNPELPEENQSNQKKPNENKDEGGNIKAFTPRPSLISRQSSLSKPEGIPQSVSTNKPDEGQRNARDAQDKDSKIDNGNTTPKADLPNSRAFPSYPKIAPGSAPIVNAKDESKRDARDTDSNTKNEDQKTKLNTNVNYRIGDKSFSASTTKKPDDGKREVRDTEHEKSNEEGNISTQRPALVPTLSTFNKPTSQSVSTTKPDNLNEGQRGARDTEHDMNNDNDNTTPKANIGNSWTNPSAPRRSFDTTPQLGVKSFSTSTKPDNEGKRDARDTDHENNSTADSDTNNKKAYPQHLILIPREKSLNRPTLQSVTTTSKPDSPIEQKRSARDTEDENTTPKLVTTQTHPLNPKTSSFDSKTLSTSTKKPENAHEDKRNARDTEHNNDGTSKPDGLISSNPKTVATQSAPTQDKTTENKNEDNATSRPLFIPPPGYQRVVTANHDEKDRFARDADSNEKQDNTKIQSSSTVQPLSKNDGLKRIPPRLYASRVQYQPLPYSTQVTTSTVSPTTKSQNKRDTEPKISQTEEDKLKTVPRMFGEQGQNSPTSKPNPVISIQ